MVLRRSILGGGIALGAAAMVSGCGTGAASDPQGPVTLRMAWWGNDVRNELTRKVIALFESKHENITVEGETGEFTTYFEKLSTQAAGRDLPDVIQMDAQMIREYGERGALLALTDEVDVSGFLESSQRVGVIGDTRYAVNGAVTERVYLANPDVFRAAKVDVPDDSTWTWQDYADVASAVSKATPDGTWGSANPALEPNNVLLWLLQHDADLFTEQGLGFTPDLLAGFFELCLQMTKDGSAPPASVAVEELSKGTNQSLFWTGKAGLANGSSNQVVATSAATEADIQILRYPSQTGKAVDARAYVTGLSWSIGSTSKNVEAAATLVDFILNDVDAGLILGDERGLPPNNAVREAVTKDFEGPQLKAAEFLELTASEMGEPPVTPLAGGSNWHDVVSRQSQDLLFERATPAEAAQKVHDELGAAIQR